MEPRENLLAIELSGNIIWRSSDICAHEFNELCDITVLNTHIISAFNTESFSKLF